MDKKELETVTCVSIAGVVIVTAFVAVMIILGAGFGFIVRAFNWTAGI